MVRFTRLTTEAVSRPLSSGGEKLCLEGPRGRVRIQGFAAPMEPVRRDVGEGPTGPGAVPARAFLKDVAAAPTADLFLVVPADRVGPRDPPGFGRRVPRAQRAAVHVHGPVGIRTTLIRTRHDPHV